MSYYSDFQRYGIVPDLVAGEDLTDKEGRGVAISAAGSVTLADTTGAMMAVLLEGAASGEPVSVVTEGPMKVYANGNSDNISAADMLKLTTDGIFIKAAAAAESWGQSWEDLTADGKYILVNLSVMGSMHD